MAPICARTSAMSSQSFERGVAGHLGGQVGQRPRARPLLGLLGHLAVLDLDHRLDGEEGAQQGLGTADAATALEEVEPTQHAVDMDPAGPIQRGRGQGVETGAGRRLLGRGDHHEALAHGQ